MKYAWILAGALLVLNGCSPPVQSVYPLYRDADTVFLPELLGTWTPEDGEGMLEWAQGKDNGYIVRAHGIKEDKPSVSPDLSVHLVKLGGHYFADVYTEKFPEVADSSDCTAPFWAPTHLFLLLVLDDSVMRVFMLDPEFASGYLQKHSCAIRHILREPIQRYSTKDPSGKPEYDIPVLLTDTPKHLQRFIKKIAKSPDAFKKNEPLFTLKRLPKNG